MLATHQTEDVAALCDQLVVLLGERVLFDGTIADFFATADAAFLLRTGPDWTSGNPLV